MGMPTLLPFEKVKAVISQVKEERILQYEGALCSQILEGGQSVSVVEIKVVFEDDTGRPSE